MVLLRTRVARVFAVVVWTAQDAAFLRAQEPGLGRTSEVSLEHTIAVDMYGHARQLENSGRQQEALARYARAGHSFDIALTRYRTGGVERLRMAALHDAALCAVEAARLAIRMGHQTEAARRIVRAEFTVRNLDAAQEQAVARTGRYDDPVYPWRINYLWGSIRVLQGNFASAQRYFLFTYQLNPSFVPSEAIARVIQEYGLANVDGPAPLPGTPSASPSKPPAPEPARPPKNVQTPPSKPPVPPSKPRVAPSPVPPSGPPQAGRTAGPVTAGLTATVAPPPLAATPACPSLLSALQQVVGANGVLQYAGGLAALGANWLTRASLGPWGAALAIGGAVFQISGKLWEDLEKARKAMPPCEAPPPRR